MHRNPEIRETLTILSSSGPKLLLPSLSLGFSTQGERERERERHTHTHTIFTMLTIPSGPTTHGASRRPHWTGLAQVQKINSLRLGLNLDCYFSKITQNPQPIASGHDVIHIPCPIIYLGFLLWHLRLSHPPCTSVSTCAQCVPLPAH